MRVVQLLYTFACLQTYFKVYCKYLLQTNNNQYVCLEVNALIQLRNDTLNDDSDNLAPDINI